MQVSTEARKSLYRALKGLKICFYVVCQLCGLFGYVLLEQPNLYCQSLLTFNLGQQKSLAFNQAYCVGFVSVYLLQIIDATAVIYPLVNSCWLPVIAALITSVIVARISNACMQFAFALRGGLFVTLRLQCVRMLFIVFMLFLFYSSFKPIKISFSVYSVRALFISLFRLLIFFAAILDSSLCKSLDTLIVVRFMLY